MVGIWKELSGSFIFEYDGYSFFLLLSTATTYDKKKMARINVMQSEPSHSVCNVLSMRATVVGKQLLVWIFVCSTNAGVNIKAICPVLPLLSIFRHFREQQTTQNLFIICVYTFIKCTEMDNIKMNNPAE